MGIASVTTPSKSQVFSRRDHKKSNENQQPPASFEVNVLVSSTEHSPNVEYFLDLCKNGNFAKGPKKSKRRKD